MNLNFYAKCPYCYTIKLMIEAPNALYDGWHLVQCDDKLSGCKQHYVIVTALTVEHEVYTLEKHEQKT